MWKVLIFNMIPYLKYRKCAVVGCSTNSAKTANVKLFRFPAGKNDSARYAAWAKLAGISNVEKQSCAFMCALHFTDDQFRGTDKYWLRIGAVPTIGPKVESTLHPDVPTCVERDGCLLVQSTPSVEVNGTILSTPSTSRTSVPRKLDFSLVNVEEERPCDLSVSRCATPTAGLKSVKSGLSLIGATRINSLTPKKQKLIHRNRQLENQLRVIKKRYKKKSLDLNNIMTLYSEPIHLVDKLTKHMSFTSATLLASQIRCSALPAKGRRWTTNEKLLALAILKRSPKCYKLLRTLFCLPTRQTLLSMLQDVQFLPGINPHIFNMLQETMREKSVMERTCTLMFDEMSIREHVGYDKKHDEIVGFENAGHNRKTSQVANYACVFMAKGLLGKWKQPLAFYFTRGCVKGESLATLLNEVLLAAKNAGLLIVCTVCDMGSNNVKALKLMGATTEKPYFSFEGEQIVTIFDPPHLLKCVRNMLYRHDASVPLIYGGNCANGVASWNDIRTAVSKDERNFFRAMHKLKEIHMDPSGPSAMKVNVAAQTLSHTVAATINTFVSTGAMSNAALATAHFVGTINETFDSVNGATCQPSGAKGLRCQVRLDREMFHLKFWSNAIKELASWHFFRSSSGGDNRTFQPPCIKGWLTSLHGFQLLWHNLKKMGFSYFCPRSVNQDSLEHLFGNIRAYCGSNHNPTTDQFIHALKTCVLNDLTLSDLKGFNCEVEVSPGNFLLNLRQFVQTDLSSENCLNLNKDKQDTIHVEENVASEVPVIGDIGPSLAYIAGYIGKRVLGKNECVLCRNVLCCADPSLCINTGLEFREYSDNCRGLTYPSENLLICIGKISTILEQLLDNVSHIFYVKSVIKRTITPLISWDWLHEACIAHASTITDSIVDSICLIGLLWWCKKKNRTFVQAKRDAIKKK